MKTMVLTVFVLFSISSPLAGQEHHLWIGLSRHRVMPDVVLHTVQDEFVTVSSDGRVSKVWLVEVEQVRVIQEGLIMRGAAVGASVGVAIGGLVGFLGASRDDRNSRVGTTALVVGVMGGIIGSVLESVPEKGEIIELRDRAIDSKREVFEKILRSGDREENHAPQQEEDGHEQRL